MLHHFSHVLFSVTPMYVAHQAPLSMGFSRQEHWSGLPCPPPGDLPDPGTESVSPASYASWADSSHAESLGKSCMQSTSFEISDWMNHNMESRLLGEISTISDMQMIPLFRN